MNLDPWRADISTSADRYASLALDCTKEHPDDVDALKLRWKQARQELRSAGAPEDVLDLLGGRLAEPDGRGGRIGRLIVASTGNEGPALVADIGLPDAPEETVARWCPVPDLMPLVRTGSRHPRHLRVIVDRAGARIERYGALGELEDSEGIDGDHDVLHKVRAGDASQQRLQRRAEDSWERNAAQVAARIDAVVREHRPSVVVVAGDERATRAVAERCEPATRRVLTVVHGALDERTVREAVDGVVAERIERALEQFSEQEGRQDRAVQGRAEVAGALRRGQASHILLTDPAPTHGTVRLGPDGLAAEDGTGDPVDATVALTIGAMVTGAEIVLVPEGAALTDGAGAVLRWADSSTPRDLAPSMPGHGAHRGSHH